MKIFYLNKYLKHNDIGYHSTFMRNNIYSETSYWQTAEGLCLSHNTNSIPHKAIAKYLYKSNAESQLAKLYFISNLSAYQEAKRIKNEGLITS